METREEVDVGVAVAVSEAFSEEHACEHPDHAKSVLGSHGGPGAWYANIRCPECGSHRVYVMCDPYKRWVQVWSGDFWCMECRATLPASDLVVGFTAIGGGL